jgi:hypothetical protein
MQLRHKRSYELCDVFDLLQAQTIFRAIYFLQGPDVSQYIVDGC